MRGFGWLWLWLEVHAFRARRRRAAVVSAPVLEHDWTTKGVPARVLHSAGCWCWKAAA